MPQTGREALLEQITAIADRVAKAQGLEIVELEFLGGGKQRVLRIYIDKPEGVTHEDCEIVSQQVGDILDAEDVIPGENYTLEVSSPGVERKLTKPADYPAVCGQEGENRDCVSRSKIRSTGKACCAASKAMTCSSSRPKVGWSASRSTGIKRANLKFEW